jgi:sugar phosphate isomerase/epimerase
MKLGFVSAILPEFSFEKLIDYASLSGFACIEVCCWPVGKAERRYAGVTHIDVDLLDEAKVLYINNYLKEKNISISALGYYPNPLDPDQQKSDFYVAHIKKVIEASNKLGINQINTFIGRDQHKTTDQNFGRFLEIWKPIVACAEALKVKIGIENCPMLFTKDEWPGGHNLATTPKMWRQMFDAIPSDYFGLNYDPSHLLWMQMDYIKPIYDFKEKIFHVHIKDAKVYPEKLAEVGIMAYPLEFHSPKLPGLGDIDWGRFAAALMDTNYQGPACIEVEDKDFEASTELKQTGIILSKQYLNQWIK